MALAPRRLAYLACFACLVAAHGFGDGASLEEEEEEKAAHGGAAQGSALGAWRWPRLGGSVDSSLLRRLRLSSWGLHDDGEELRRLSTTNSTGNLTNHEEGDPIINAIIGTFTVMGGTRIMPVILLINGFIAAEVGTAFDNLVDDFTPQNIVTLFLRVLSGVSVGTVGIQNMNFQSTLQGAVLFASLLNTVRRPLEDEIKKGVSGPVQEWLLLAIDAAVTSIGAGLALAFRALFKVLNSAYLSATMFMLGWIRVIEHATGEDTVSATVETVLTVITTLFCLWWHSLIVSKARKDEWSARFKAQAKFKVKSSLQKVTELLVTPIAVANKLVSGFSMALGLMANLKARPRTGPEILEIVADKLGLASVSMLVVKQLVRRRAISFVRVQFAAAGSPPERTKQATKLTGQVCGALTVKDMRQVVFDIREKGNFTEVLNSCFEDVAHALKDQALIDKGKGKEVNFDADALAQTWEDAKEAITAGVLRQSKAVAKPAVVKCCGLSDKAQKEYVEGLIDQLDLQELTLIIKMVRSGRFSLSDLIELAESKARHAAVHAKALAEKKAAQAMQAASKGIEGAAANAEAAIEGADTELQAQAKALAPEAAHGMAPPEAGGLGDVAKQALEKSNEKAVGRLAECMCDILDVREAIDRVPGLGKAVVGIQDKVNKFLAGTLGVVPFLGPQLIKLAIMAQAKLKTMILTKGLAKAFKQAGVPLSLVADAVQKLAAMDEYLDDALEQLLNPGAALAAATGKVAKEPGGLTGLALRQVNKFGPSACREMLVYAMVEIFELDPAKSESFVKMLTPKDLMMLGQEVLRGGFPFAACTKLVKMKTEEVTFKIPVSFLEDGLGDSQIGIDFKSPPVVISVDDEWIQQVVDETDTEGPMKGDKLVFLGKQAAMFMQKEEFEMQVKGLVGGLQAAAKEAAAKGSQEPSVKLVFTRGLDVDFAQRFREVLPSVLRKFLGVPFDEGSDLARNVTMDHMQKLVFILLNGGIKRLDDLAMELGVEVNFEQAFKASIPRKLVMDFGFAHRGATRFVNSLDPAAGLGPRDFMTRIQQMVGFGELEAMSGIICRKDVRALDALHKRRFHPRVDLSRLLDVDPRKAKDIRVNLVVSEKGAFELWKDGSPLGKVKEDTFAIVLAIWRELQETHLDEDSREEDVPEWSGEEPVEALEKACTDHHKMHMTKTFFKWPDMVIEKAGLSEADAAVARRLFFDAIAEARESVYDKYERKILAQARICFGYEQNDGQSSSKNGLAEDADTEAADVAQLIQERQRGCKNVEAWIQKLYGAFPPASKGDERQKCLKLLEKSLMERDTFRLSKLATKYGVTDPVPIEGLLKKLSRDLAGLPLDIGANADKISAYLTSSKHPLTGKLAGSHLGGPAPPAPAPGGKKFQAEAAHGAPPPDYSAAGVSQFAVELEVLYEAPGTRQLVADALHQAEPPPAAGVPKLKEIFSLAQKGSFDQLSRYTAASTPGGTGAVCKQMRETIMRTMPSRFGISTDDARAAVERLLSTTHCLVDRATICLEAPDDLSCIAEDERDGEELKKGIRVSIAEEKGACVRLSKPAQGWLLASEIKPAPPVPGADQRQMELTTHVLRCVKGYHIVDLQELGDELGWDLDFVQLCQKRIVETMTEKLSRAYQPNAIKRAARQLKDTNTLRACMDALDRRDMNFVVDALSLQRPPKKLEAKKPHAEVAKKPQPSHRERELEKQLKKAHKDLELAKEMMQKNGASSAEAERQKQAEKEAEDLRHLLKKFDEELVKLRAAAATGAVAREGTGQKNVLC